MNRLVLHWLKPLLVTLAILLPASLQGKTDFEARPALESHDFEVEEFHTYFVGEVGVWVHNSSDAPCERVFSIFRKLLARNSGDVWRAFETTRSRISRFADSEVLRLRLFNEARSVYFSTNVATKSPPWHNVSVQVRPAGATGSPARLGANMEKTMLVKKPPYMASHHIVEKLDNPAVRDVIERAGIHIDEAANGVWLKRDMMTRLYQNQMREGWLDGLGPRHEGSHSQSYSDAVADRILPLDGQPADVIRNELQLIGKELVEGSFPWP